MPGNRDSPTGHFGPSARSSMLCGGDDTASAHHGIGPLQLQDVDELLTQRFLPAMAWASASHSTSTETWSSRSISSASQ
eukprot:13462763-Alexandrium_andersonii.AAC.1